MFSSIGNREVKDYESRYIGDGHPTINKIEILIMGIPAVPGQAGGGSFQSIKKT